MTFKEALEKYRAALTSGGLAQMAEFLALTPEERDEFLLHRMLDEFAEIDNRLKTTVWQ